MKWLRNILIAAVMVVGFVLPSMSKADVSLWVYGGPDMVIESEADDVTLRIGYVHGQTEIGLSSTWYDLKESPHVFGAYSFYSLPYDVNVPTLIPWDVLPKTLKATPYIGGVISLDFLGDGRLIGPAAGVKIENTIFTEVQYLSYDGELGSALSDTEDFRWLFGLYKCWRF